MVNYNVEYSDIQFGPVVNYSVKYLPVLCGHIRIIIYKKIRIWSCGKLQCAIHTFSSSPSLGSAVRVGDLKGEQGEGRPEPRLFILIKSVHVIRLLNSLTYYEFRLKHYRVRHHEHSGE